MWNKLKKWYQEQQLKADCKELGVCYKHKEILQEGIYGIRDYDWCKSCFAEERRTRLNKVDYEQQERERGQQQLLMKLK